jgi:hypothetical protein
MQTGPVLRCAVNLLRKEIRPHSVINMKLGHLMRLPCATKVFSFFQDARTMPANLTSNHTPPFANTDERTLYLQHGQEFTIRVFQDSDHDSCCGYQIQSDEGRACVRLRHVTRVGVFDRFAVHVLRDLKMVAI